jgi:CarD family transcriptional regulator
LVKRVKTGWGKHIEQVEEAKMFKAGDAIIHPVRGAGIVEGIEERRWRGRSDLYYRIRLLGQEGTSLMIPVDAAKTLGLRRAIPRFRLGQVWRVLRGDPETLPADHRKRYQLLKGKLHAGDVFQVAEAVRDMAWRQQREGRLTTVGKRIYEEGITLLAGEIAATQSIDLADAETQIRGRLRESLSPVSVM